MAITNKELAVLVIEDNAGDAVLVTDLLEEGISQPIIHNATTFTQAKESLINGFCYDVILLDLTLPDNSGEQLVHDIILLAANTPVIVLTGYSSRDFGVKTLSLGVSDYLLKDDLSLDQLIKSITYSIERKRVNVKLKDSEEKYKSLFSLSPMPMWVFDVNTFEFLNVNDAAIRQYGYSREEFLHMTIKDIRPPDDMRKIEEIVAESRNSNAFSWGEFRHLKKGGQLIYVDIKSNLIDFEGKKARLVLATDITERVQHMKAIEKQNKRLQEIAWSQSHVVRAPLARMMGLVNVLSLKKDLVKNQDEILDLIMHSAKELDDILRDIVKKTEIE